jgi:Domain of unknown function (DUF1844)
MRFFFLQVLPPGLHLGQRRTMDRSSFSFEAPLERLEARSELLIRPAERGLRLDPQFSGEIRQGEEQIAHFFFRPVAGVSPERFGQLIHLLPDLRDDILGPGPVEAHGPDASSDFVRAQERGQRAFHAAQDRSAVTAGTLLVCFDLFPLRLDTARRQRPLSLENVRMSADELAGDCTQRISDGESPFVRAYLGEEDTFEDQVADLSLERLEVAAIDRVEDFVGFLQHVRPQRRERLLAIPGTATWSPQPRHRVGQFLKPRTRPRSASGCLRNASASQAFALAAGRGPRPRPFCHGGLWYHRGPMTDSAAPPDLDPAFSSLIIMLASAAAVHFGDLADAVSGERQPLNLEGAAQMIGLLEMIEAKTRGNLAEGETRLLQQVLYELRLRFVDAQKQDRRIIEP